MTVLVYLVLPQLSSGVGMLLLCGVFFFQIIIDTFKTPHWYWCQNNRCSCAVGERNGYNLLRTGQQKLSVMERIVRFVQIIFENKAMKIVALLIQIFGFAGFITAWVIGMNTSIYSWLGGVMYKHGHAGNRLHVQETQYVPQCICEIFHVTVL